MKLTIICLVITFTCLNAASIKQNEAFEFRDIEPSTVNIRITNTNMPSAMARNLVDVVTASYKKVNKAEDFTKCIVHCITQIYSSYHWSALYDTLAYTTTESYYAELTINDKDALYVHAVNKHCDDCQ